MHMRVSTLPWAYEDAKQTHATGDVTWRNWLGGLVRKLLSASVNQADS